MSETRTIPAAGGTANVVTFTLKVDGTEVPRSFQVSSVVCSRVINKIPYCTVTILDGSPASADFPASSGSLFIPGKKMECFGGFGGKEKLMFKGLIIKQSVKVRETATPMLMVEVRDELLQLTMGKKCKYFSEKKDSEIIEEIAGTYGVQKEVEATTAALKEVVQYQCSDWDFIVTRAEVNGKLCFAENGKLIIKKPVSGSSVLDIAYGATVLEFDAEMDARNQYKGVKSFAWNYTDQELKEITANEPSLPAQGNISYSDLAAVAHKSEVLLHHGGKLEQDELQAWADAQLLKSRMAKIQGRVRIRGFGEVMPGNTIKLSGVGDRFNGDVYVTGVRHEMFGGGWTTDIQFGISPEFFAKENEVTHIAAGGMLPGAKGLQVGVVTSLEDDIGEFRVKVKIPFISTSDEGIWARMVMPDAGNKRGFFFRPEVGDEVIVGFLDENPNKAVIIGCVFSSKLVSPVDQTKDNDQKGLVTRSEMKWLWDDKKKSMTVETPKGKKFVIDEDAGEIKMEDENNNKIIMNSDGITIESGKDIIMKATRDFKVEGVNTEVKASASATYKSSGPMEVNSSANTTVKGSMVMIN